MLYLKALSAILGQTLVVRHMRDKVCHIKVERLHQLGMSDLLVFDRVVQIAGSHKVRVSPGICQQCGHVRQVVEVRFR